MGSKTIGKALGMGSSPSNNSSSGTYEPQYVKLADGSYQLYDQSKATLNYAPAQTVQGAKGQRALGDSAFGKTGGNRRLASAQYDGQDIELSNGNIKFYNQTDYDNWQKERTNAANQLKTATNAANQLKTATNAALQNLSDARNNRNKTKKTSLFTTAGLPGGGGGTGVFTGIVE